MRRLAVLLVVLAASAALPQGMEPGGLTRLSTGDATRGWEAVGRLDIGQGGFCTGALISDDLVLTAAHCLFDRVTGQRIPVEQMQFLAGWRNGRAEAYRGVRRAVSHPEYDFGQEPELSRVAVDMALVELDRPIRSTHIRPFETAPHLQRGAQVGVVSYAEDRSEAPSLQEVCHVLEAYGGVVMLSCSVDFGASGAPIFLLDGERPQIASVVSAKAEAFGQPVALASEIGLSFDRLQAALSPQVVPLRGSEGGGRSANGAFASGGAKFLRP